MSWTRYIHIFKTDRGLSFQGNCLTSLSNGIPGTSILLAKQVSLWKAYGNGTVVSIYDSEDQQWNPPDERHKKSWIYSYKPSNHSQYKCNETKYSWQGMSLTDSEKQQPSAYSKINPNEIKWNRVVLHEITGISLRCCRSSILQMVNLRMTREKLCIYHHQWEVKIII